MQTRAAMIFFFLLCVACSRDRGKEIELPVQVDGWKLMETENLPAESVPEIVRQLGIRRAVRARYDGTPAITLTMYEMSAAASAFELRQKWPPAANEATSHRDHLFLVAAGGSEKRPLIQFLAALETKLGN